MPSSRQPSSAASTNKNKLSAPGNQLSDAARSLTSSQVPVGSWKDHPLVVAAVAVAGAIGLMILIVKEIILPTYMTSLQNQLQEIPKLQTEKAAADQVAKAAEKVIKDMDQQLKEKDAQITNLKTKLANAEAGNLFAKNVPYPISLGKITIGMPISEVDKVFPAKAIRKRDEYWSVEDQHSVFADITYYFNEEDKAQRITHISFSKGFLREKRSAVDLHEKMVEVFGPPTIYSRADFFSWKLPTGHKLYKSSKDSYLLMDARDMPLIWPKK